MNIILELIILAIVLAMNYIIPWLNLSYYSLKHGINLNILLCKYDHEDKFYNTLEASKAYIFFLCCIEFLQGFLSLGSTTAFDEILMGVILTSFLLTVGYLTFICDNLDREITQAITYVDERQPIKF
jgi:hypothetical protein